MGRIIRDKQPERLPIIGNIKVGEKYIAPSGKESVRGLDYFIPDGDYAESLLKTLGDPKPNILHITFLSDDDDFSCDERYELWSGKRLVAYGDGKNFYEYIPKSDTYELKTTDQFPDIKKEIEQRIQKKSTEKHPPEWSAVLKLRFHILEFKEVAGVWQFTTRGEKSSIKEIVSSYDMVKNMAGRVVGVPFDLKVKKVKSNKPGTSHSFPVVSLLANIGTESLERVRELISHNIEIRGLITPSKLDGYQGKLDATGVQNQIEYSDAENENKSSEKALEAEVVNDAKIVRSPDFEKASSMLESAKDLIELKSAVGFIKNQFKLDDNEKHVLNLIYEKMVEELK